MKQKLVFLFVSLLGFRTEAFDLKPDKKHNDRVGKLFWISTSSTTTSLATTTVCWKSSSTAITAACGKKRRSIEDDPLDIEEDTRIQPTLLKLDNTNSLENDHEAELESGVRAGRFAVYWKTTTITSTSTSYSSTSTLASLKCTPNNFVISECG
eukprot:TRINITY_DN3583_c0_g1_i1.p1 TRINITY_DN3583_c0_g1~~TRINITY_DN3583_c0_g1_i1.p1  ORF type:complete len:154 (+),score=22.91 TRINITY_DN3583_c0_g1_i1:50-511(+)